VTTASTIDSDKKELVKTYFEYGEDCLAQFDIELAQEAFQRVLDYEPNHAGAKFGMEIIEFWTPSTSEGLVTNEMQQMRLSVLLRRAPQSIPLLLMKSNLEWEANEQESAIQIAEEALKINPNTATTLLQLGYYWHSKGDLDTAMSYYQKSLAANPKFALGHTNLGYVYHIRRDFSSAVFHMDKAARLNYNLLTLIYLGDEYRYLGNFSQALAIHKNAEQFLETQKEVPQRFYLGEWLVNYMPLIGQEDLIHSHVFARSPDEKNSFLYFSLALDMIFSGNETAADAYFEKVKALDPIKNYYNYFSNILESNFEELKVTKESAVFPWMQRVYQELNA
jgi:tetratricopeptide (TPR) repeat protein